MLQYFLICFLLAFSSLSAQMSVPEDLYARLQELGEKETNPLLIVDVQSQCLLLFKDKKLSRSYVISTAAKGLGSREQSFKTPEGLHRVIEKIGSRSRLYSIFNSRKDTGQLWSPERDSGADLILTRIIRLEGLETGSNRGYDRNGYLVDSYDRYIYIHGTNHERNLGTACSQGCVRMASEDIVDLFTQVPQGTLLWITASLRS